jgi:hypothetical protein
VVFAATLTTEGLEKCHCGKKCHNLVRLHGFECCA